jgi:DNA-binding LacI/PurR family transcriptional regulator
MTVSNAFNHPDRLSAALRERVLATAAELGYAGPNPIARTLSRGETNALGLVFDYGLTLALTDPAMVMLLYGVASVCEEREMGLSLVPRFPGRRDAAQVHTALVDGFVLHSVTDDDPRLAAVRERRLPYALIDYDPGEELVVTVDDRGAARQMAEHLVALGHRRIAIVIGWEGAWSLAGEAAGRATWSTVRARMDGWRDGLEAAGIDFDSVQVASGPGFDRETGHVAGGRLLDRAERPTAVLAISDLLALGVLDAAAERGVSVPRELSVIGFDDIPAAATSTPSLTTVRQPHRDKGACAVRLLLDGVKPPHTVILPTELVVRSSTGRAGSKS